jgi:hypothetical protein
VVLDPLLLGLDEVLLGICVELLLGLELELALPWSDDVLLGLELEELPWSDDVALGLELAPPEVVLLGLELDELPWSDDVLLGLELLLLELGDDVLPDDDAEPLACTPSALMLCWSSCPVCGRFCACWNLRSALSVADPHFPSTAPES